MVIVLLSEFMFTVRTPWYVPPPWLHTDVGATGKNPHPDHVTSSKRSDTLRCHNTMRRNPINFLYNQGHVTL